VLAKIDVPTVVTLLVSLLSLAVAFLSLNISWKNRLDGRKERFNDLKDAVALQHTQLEHLTARAELEAKERIEQLQNLLGVDDLVDGVIKEAIRATKNLVASSRLHDSEERELIDVVIAAEYSEQKLADLRRLVLTQKQTLEKWNTEKRLGVSFANLDATIEKIRKTIAAKGN
jgi:hypothetical protein